MLGVVLRPRLNRDGCEAKVVRVESGEARDNRGPRDVRQRRPAGKRVMIGVGVRVGVAGKAGRGYGQSKQGSGSK